MGLDQWKHLVGVHHQIYHTLVVLDHPILHPNYPRCVRKQIKNVIWKKGDGFSNLVLIKNKEYRERDCLGLRRWFFLLPGCHCFRRESRWFRPHRFTCRCDSEANADAALLPLWRFLPLICTSHPTADTWSWTFSCPAAASGGPRRRSSRRRMLILFHWY